LPKKRFAASCLLARVAEYLKKPKVSYRGSVRHGRQKIGYPLDDARGDEQVCEQAVVDHSLIWRMAGWLGALSGALDKAREMLLQSNPDSTCHRITGGGDPHKARSPERLTTLAEARQLLLVMSEWEECFGRKFFPRFATRSGFD
jgi:hypothetical protein